MAKVPHSTYPIIQLTQSEYAQIPRAEDLPRGFLNTCPIGTLFRCRGSNKIIGQLVKGDDALGEQYGAGLSVPERFVNRYRIQVIHSDSLDSAQL